MATAVLNNIAIINKEEIPPVDVNEEHLNYLIEIQRVPDQPIMAVNDVGARAFRNEIVQFFQNIY